MEEEVVRPKRKSETVQDSDLIKSIIFLKAKGLLKEPSSKIIFETVKEAEDSSKEDITSVIKEKLNTLKEDISSLQKDGTPLKLYTLKLIQVPMKVKVWQSTLTESDLRAILDTMDKISLKIKPLKEALEEKERLS